MKQKIKETFDKLKAGVLRTLSANIINKAVSMISSMAITRLLSTTDYGIWSYVLNLYSYFSLVSGLGLISGALQFGAENNGNEKSYSFFKYCSRTGIFIDLGLVVVFGTIIAFI